MKGKVNQQERSQRAKKAFSEKEKYFLAGFFEGNGSFYVSIKKNKSSRYGFLLDPGIAFCEHEKGLHLLLRCQRMLGTGRLEKKADTSPIHQLVISHRRSIREKFIPFYRKYACPFSAKREAFDIFAKIVEGLERKDHHSSQGMISLLEKTYELSQISQSRERKYALEDLIALVKSSETTRLEAASEDLPVEGHCQSFHEKAAA